MMSHMIDSAPSKKKYLIIKTGHAPAPIIDHNGGDYDEWFRRAMRIEPRKDEFHAVTVCDGEPLPSVEHIETSFCGIIITGSPAMVTDHHEWSVRAEKVIRQLVLRSRIYILGVCYGHQLLGEAMGGVVGDNPNGATLGTKQVTFNKAALHSDPLFSALRDCHGGDGTFWAHVSHKQVVRTVPSGCTILGFNTVDPHHVIRFGPKAWGTQFHPEFNVQLAQDHIRMRSSYVIGAVGPQRYNEFLDSIRETAIGDLIFARFRALCESCSHIESNL